MEALRVLYDLNDVCNLGDLACHVREKEGQGWEGPRVQAWGNACKRAKALLDGYEPSPISDGQDKITLASWIKWAFVPWPKGRHFTHSYALCRQAERDMGVPLDHAKFVAAMTAAGYRVVAHYGSAYYFDCLDSKSKREYYRKRFLNCDDRVQHPLCQNDGTQEDRTSSRVGS